MEPHKIVSREEWLTERLNLLAEEKAFTRQRDRLSAKRRALPWVKVDKKYVFDAPEGKMTLADLFEGRSQLVVDHFMLAPGWGEGCVGCSFGADHIGNALVHLEHHDVTTAVVSRAPIAEIEAYKARMGWKFKWVSSYGSDFNYDYHVSFTPEDFAKGKVYYNYRMTEGGMEELPGLSVFFKDGPEIFHTYSSYARGAEELLTTYMVLDLTPKGRNEMGPHRNLMDWVKRHDEYETAGGTVDHAG
ncbi:MAG TPA: thioredoxin family protein [Stellaceae bacterium]|jgi:predicted dithiol-disulfide oxidoreductase (DUF899 family)|nr:thioredoxin family protein [Stellaceae bacterium]